MKKILYKDFKRRILVTCLSVMSAMPISVSPVVANDAVSAKKPSFSEDAPRFFREHALAIFGVGAITAVGVIALLKFLPFAGNSSVPQDPRITRTVKDVQENAKLLSSISSIENDPRYTELVAAIKKDLTERVKLVYQACIRSGHYRYDGLIGAPDGKFDSVYDALVYLLGGPESAAAKYAKENYPEWERRLTGICEPLIGKYNGWTGLSGGCAKYQCFGLASIAYALRLAAVYNPKINADKNLADIDFSDLKDLSSSDSELEKQRLDKVIVVDGDILRSAHKFVLNHPEYCKNGFIGILNAGDRRLACGFIPGWGSVLEEFLAMMTTLPQLMSCGCFYKTKPETGSWFYDTEFKPLCGLGQMLPPLNKVRNYLTNLPEGFYDVLINHGVRLTRSLGAMMQMASGKYKYVEESYREDTTFAWNRPVSISPQYPHQCSVFDPPVDGLGSINFPIVSIGGIEDRSKNALKIYGNESLKLGDRTTTVRERWEEITERQCELALKAFYDAGVKVPFLSAFGAGAFGGDVNMVARCWYNVLINKGYIDKFDKVVFPIGYNETNTEAFAKQFKKLLKPVIDPLQ